MMLQQLLATAHPQGGSFLPVSMTIIILGVGAVAMYAAPALRRPARRILSQPSFLAAVVVLGISALGLNAATSFLELHFKKLPVPLAVRSLSEGIPATLGPWVQVSKDQPIDPEVQQVLGTSQYVFRDYINTREWPDQVDILKDLPDQEREAALMRLQFLRPQSVLRISITYYTGMADTVAHIPERCYVGDGYEVTTYDTKAVTCGTYDHGPQAGKPRDLTFRLIHFEDQTASRRVSHDVGYLFHVNGVYESDSYRVRGRLQDLTERYGYYAKVEMMLTRPPGGAHTDDGPIVNTMTDFLTFALPEIERCLPDWQKLRATTEH
jgi:hypothetical protein